MRELPGTVTTQDTHVQASSVVEHVAESDNNNILNPRIGKKGSEYYFKEHLKHPNKYLEVIKHHLLYAKEHSQENPVLPSYYNKSMEILSEKTTSC